MLVILMDEQLIATEQVCQGCLLADRSGAPRWREGKLSCGRALRDKETQSATLYQCQMGFRLTNID